PDCLTPTQNPSQVIVAQLRGSDECSARNITVKSSAPVIGLCRALRGRNPSLRDHAMHCYRDGVLALIVRGLGEAVELRVSGSGTHFLRAVPEPTAASPMRSDEEAATPTAGQEATHV